MGAVGPASPRRLDRADITVTHAPPNQEMLRQAREWFTKALKVDPQMAVAKEFMRLVRYLVAGGALPRGVPSRGHVEQVASQPPVSTVSPSSPK